jgi:WD40 repeat protein
VIVMSGKVKVVDRLQFAADASTLAGAGWTGFQVWDRIEPGARARLFPSPKHVTGFGFIGNSRQLFVSGYPSSFSRADPDLGVCNPLPWARQVQRFALAPDGGRHILQEYVDRAYTLSCREANPPYTPLWERAGPGTPCYGDVQYLPSGGSVLLLLSTSYHRRDERFVLLSADSGEEISRSNVLAEYSKDTTVAPDESLVACMTRVYIRIYPLREPFREPLRTIVNDVNRHFTGIAFHPSGRYLAATSNDATVKLFDTTTWEIARTFTWDIGRMRSICFNRDGTLAAAGSDTGKVIVWDVDV